MKRVHFQVRVGIFNCQQILAKISFVIFDIMVKIQIEFGLTWDYWWLGFTDLGLINWHVFEQSECRNCCLYIIIQKIAPQAESGKFFQIWFFPRFGGKNGGVLSMRMQVILDSSFARPGSAPIRGGKKGEFRDWTRYGINYAGMQIAQWNFPNKGKSGWTGKSSFVLEAPLRYLRSTLIYSLPFDRNVQRAYSVATQSRSQSLCYPCSAARENEDLFYSMFQLNTSLAKNRAFAIAPEVDKQ